MLTNQKSFFITLTSNTSLNLYPQNTLSKFTTKLPISLDFKNTNDDEWSVGIVKFCCTKIEGKIAPSSIPKIVFINAKKHTETESFTPVLFSIQTEKNVVDELNIIDILRQHPDLLNLVKRKNFFDRYTLEGVDLPIHNYFPTNTVPVLVGGELCLVLLNQEYSMRNLFDTLLSQIEVEKRHDVVENIKKSIREPTKVLDAEIQAEIQNFVEVILPEPVDTEYGIPNYMCIYCDVVRPQMFGNVMARGLVMHPVKHNKQYANYQNCDIVNIQYLPLEKSRITDISILIADENGEQINFKNDSFSTMIVLHFRKGI